MHALRPWVFALMSLPNPSALFTLFLSKCALTHRQPACGLYLFYVPGMCPTFIVLTKGVLAAIRNDPPSPPPYSHPQEHRIVRCRICLLTMLYFEYFLADFYIIIVILLLNSGRSFVPRATSHWHSLSFSLLWSWFYAPCSLCLDNSRATLTL